MKELEKVGEELRKLSVFFGVLAELGQSREEVEGENHVELSANLLFDLQIKLNCLAGNVQDFILEKQEAQRNEHHRR